MKRYIAGVATGLVLSCSIAFAVNYTATDNPFPIQLNGANIELNGYNIDGSTYFKLRDIADKVGGFSVDFQNSTIQLSKDGYVYDNTDKNNYVSKINPDLGWVYNAIDEQGEYTVSSGDTYKYSYVIPNFNIDSQDAKAINDEIDSGIAQYIYDDVNNIISGVSTDVKDTNYIVCQNGNILSLLINVKLSYNDVEDYAGYSVDLYTGNRITNEQLIEKTGHTTDEFYSLITGLANDEWNKLTEKLDSQWLNTDTYNSTKDRAFSEEYITTDVSMYVSDDAHLIIVPCFTTMAGDYYITLDTGWIVAQ